MSIGLLLASPSCGGTAGDIEQGETQDGADNGDTESDESAESSDSGAEGYFSTDERSVIVGWFGDIPGDPPEDPTNAWSLDPLAQALGHALFFDAALSPAEETSCASCHAPDLAFDDPQGRAGRRTPMALLNVAYPASPTVLATWQGWGGTADSPWGQALGCLESSDGMGTSRVDVALRVATNHRSAYEAAFGPLPSLFDDEFDPASIEPGSSDWEVASEVFVGAGKALGAYTGQLVSRDSRFDQFRAELQAGAIDSDLLNDEEKLGLRTFIGNGRCLGCHRGPNFTDGQFHNIGVAEQDAPDQGRREGLQTLLESEFGCDGAWSDAPASHSCGGSVLGPNDGEIGAFKTPTLRDVSRRASYMHTGAFTSLADVVAHYDAGGAPTSSFSGAKDELIRLLQLTGQERAALVAFLGSLEGTPLPPELITPPETQTER